MLRVETAARPGESAKDDLSNRDSPKALEQDWGRIYVSRKCCGSANCRTFAPALFGEVAPAGNERSVPAVLPGSHDSGAFAGVIRQPASKEDYLAARTAAAACGFGAIRLEQPRDVRRRAEMGSPWQEWPRRIEDNVWMLGHPSKRNYGALTYFIELPGGGVLVDVPKPIDQLFDWLEAHGGVKWMVLTHRDHVQHHSEFAARFPGCRRILGAADVNKRQNSYADATSSVEVKIGNDSPMTLDGRPILPEALASSELAVLPQPGHTPGSLCLLYRGRFLFTGDHLAYSRRRGHFVAHRLQCWHDWERQIESVSRLAAWAGAGQVNLQWLLPGHGEMTNLEEGRTSATVAMELGRAVDWMQQQPPGNVPLLRWIPFMLSRAKPRGWFNRLVLAIGGQGRDSWLLPRAVRRYLPDYEPAPAEAALRRLYAFVFTAALAIVGLVVWWAVGAT